MRNSVQRADVRLRNAGIAVAVLLITIVAPAATVVHAAPQPLRVQRARLLRDAPGGGARGSIKIEATLYEDVATSPTVAALLAGGVSMNVSDSRLFGANFVVSGCRATNSGQVRCKDPTGNVRATLTTGPSSFALALKVRHLADVFTGPFRAQPPIQVTVRQAAAADRIDIISDCHSGGTAVLFCNDRGRPNILYIVSDDQRWDTLQYMPNVENLAMQGVRFTNAFATTPLCGPSRASMLTGQYSHTHGVLTNDIPDGGAVRFVGRDTSTVATWLRSVGYRTGMYGKYITGYSRQCPPYTASCYIPPGWDEWHVFVNQAAYNYRLAENAEINSFGMEESAYSTDVIASKAAEFILTANGQPFFLHVGFHAPHSEGAALPVPAPRHAGSFADIAPWRPPAYDEEDMTDKPGLGSRPRAATMSGPYLTYWAWTDAIRRNQLAMLLALDEAVETLVAALDSTGQLDNTVIIFTSDNGLQWGEHRIWGLKDFPYDESIRIPLIIRHPGSVAIPQENPHLALNIDLPPTIAALAGVGPSSLVDGRSLVPLLAGTAGGWREDFGIEQSDFFVGIRGDDVKYIQWASGEEEVYDLQVDPNELDSRTTDPSYADLLTTLRARRDLLLPP